MSTTRTAVEIAKLALLLGRRDRITAHPDGYPESVTDHTVMLALLAAELAPSRLDRGRVLAYALVHDLVEAHAGDTPTLVELSPEGQTAKAAREAEALERIRQDLGAESWIVRTIEAYEAQADLEAKWVYTFDKFAPRLTQILNGGATVQAQGVSLVGVLDRMTRQDREIDRSFSEALTFAKAVQAEFIRAWTGTDPSGMKAYLTASPPRVAPPTPKEQARQERGRERLEKVLAARAEKKRKRDAARFAVWETCQALRGDAPYPRHLVVEGRSGRAACGLAVSPEMTKADRTTGDLQLVTCVGCRTSAVWRKIVGSDEAP